MVQRMSSYVFTAVINSWCLEGTSGGSVLLCWSVLPVQGGTGSIPGEETRSHVP